MNYNKFYVYLYISKNKQKYLCGGAGAVEFTLGKLGPAGMVVGPTTRSSSVTNVYPHIIFVFDDEKERTAL